MNRLKLGDVLYAASGIWAISIGLSIVIGVVKGLRK